MKKNLRILSQALSHICIVVAALYILFYILDIYNPMLLFLEKLPYIDFVLAILALLSGVAGIVAWETMRKGNHKPKQKVD